MSDSSLVYLTKKKSKEIKKKRKRSLSNQISHHRTRPAFQHSQAHLAHSKAE
jgi:hypothetical protein